MYVNVPDDRMNLLKTKLKDKLEYETGAKISIDEKIKTVNVNHDDSVKELDVKRVIEAISMGFNLSIALQLFKRTPYRFEKINIRNQTRNRKEFNRQKGRIIGKNGRTKELISELTETNIIINKDSVGILGTLDDVLKARKSIYQIIEGTPHSRVYNDLEQYQKEKSKNYL